MTRVPARVLVALWLCATGLAIVVTSVFTQDRTVAERSCNEIAGLVLDGGPTTMAPPSVGRRPEPIPWRPIDGDAATETTTAGCG